MNNSSALIAPTRSEIRVEFPSAYLPSWKKILKFVHDTYCKIAHEVSLCSVLTLFAICTFPIYVPILVMITLSIVMVLSSIFSFFIIYNELMEEG